MRSVSPLLLLLLLLLLSTFLVACSATTIAALCSGAGESSSSPLMDIAFGTIDLANGTWTPATSVNLGGWSLVGDGSPVYIDAATNTLYAFIWEDSNAPVIATITSTAMTTQPLSNPMMDPQGMVLLPGGKLLALYANNDTYQYRFGIIDPTSGAVQDLAPLPASDNMMVAMDTITLNANGTTAYAWVGTRASSSTSYQEDYGLLTFSLSTRQFDFIPISVQLTAYALDTATGIFYGLTPVNDSAAYSVVSVTVSGNNSTNVATIATLPQAYDVINGPITAALDGTTLLVPYPVDQQQTLVLSVDLQTGNYDTYTSPAECAVQYDYITVVTP